MVPVTNLWRGLFCATLLSSSLLLSAPALAACGSTAECLRRIEIEQRDLRTLRAAWDALVADTLAEATLVRPEVRGYVPEGKNGRHSEHLSYLLGEMQILARAHPGATW